VPRSSWRHLRLDIVCGPSAQPEAGTLRADLSVTASGRALRCFRRGPSPHVEAQTGAPKSRFRRGVGARRGQMGQTGTSQTRTRAGAQRRRRPRHLGSVHDCQRSVFICSARRRRQETAAKRIGLGLRRIAQDSISQLVHSPSLQLVDALLGDAELFSQLLKLKRFVGHIPGFDDSPLPRVQVGDGSL